MVGKKSTGKRTGRVSANPGGARKLPGGDGAGEGARNALLRRSVLDAAARLFAERGYGSTNLQDVASALGMSRPGLYYYFPSKESVLEALLEEVTYAIERESTEIADRVELEAEDALRLVIRTHAAWLLEHGFQFRVIVQSEHELPATLLERHNESKRRILANVSRIIERGMASGRFLPADPLIAAFGVIGMCSWTAWWFNPAGRRSILDVADAISDLAVRAVTRADVHLNCGGSPFEALKILRGDIDCLEQILRHGADPLS